MNRNVGVRLARRRHHGNVPRMRSLGLLVFVLGLVGSSDGADTGRGVTRLDLFNGFALGWRESWDEQSLFSRPTLYAGANDDGRSVLHAQSTAANSGLVRRLPPNLGTSARLSWRWKIRRPLSGRQAERTRAGDDYAARVFVVLESSWVPLRTRAINYVWSAAQPEAVYASPYTSNVAMIVLRSGATAAGKWSSEVRDLAADYRRFFGTEPTRLSAVTVLVDTYNTGETAEAWFDELVLEINQPAPGSHPNPPK